VVWPVDVVSSTGRGWHAHSEDEVLSDDGRHRLLRRNGHWVALERAGDVGAGDAGTGAAADDAWIPLAFTSPGTLAGVLDTFDSTIAG
jgi:hypothetical protein